jgi:diguanylate cyclase (GGDEF)-like protein
VSKYNILVVDDRPENLYTMKQLLESENLGYEIITAESGFIALEKVIEKEFALILLDVQMPDMNGYETAELLRGSKKTKYIPIIFVTANSREENNVFKGYDSGAVDYLFKPITPKVLISKVKVFLDLHSQKVQLEYKTEELNCKVKELEDLKAQLEEKNHRLELLTLEDSLTSIGNRRCFDQILECEWSRGIRTGHKLSLIMIDIDFFKPYNDTYGHQEGDFCLKRVTSALKSTLMRQSDIITRYGGEEFVAVLPDTDLDGAAQVGERMLKSVENLQIPHCQSSVSPYVTVSLGISSAVPSFGASPDFLVKYADQALYYSKEQGRNRSTLYSEILC